MDTAPLSKRLCLAALFGIGALLLTGCQAERTISAPIEPTWSYHDGSNQLSNNDQWREMIPDTIFAGVGQASVASVEDLPR